MNSHSLHGPAQVELSLLFFIPRYHFQMTPKLQACYFVLLPYLKSFRCHVLPSDSKGLCTSKPSFLSGTQEACVLLNSHFCPFVLAFHRGICISFHQFSWFLAPKTSVHQRRQTERNQSSLETDSLSLFFSCWLSTRQSYLPLPWGFLWRQFCITGHPVTQPRAFVPLGLDGADNVQYPAAPSPRYSCIKILPIFRGSA